MYRHGDWLKRQAGITTEMQRIRRNVHARVNYAVKAGRLQRNPACERCGKPSRDAHHDDYAKPLDVMWLCRSCHYARHRELEQVGGSFA
jgi:ribosomal protein S27AE